MNLMRDKINEEWDNTFEVYLTFQKRMSGIKFQLLVWI